MSQALQSGVETEADTASRQEVQEQRATYEFVDFEISGSGSKGMHLILFVCVNGVDMIGKGDGKNEYEALLSAFTDLFGVDLVITAVRPTTDVSRFGSQYPYQLFGTDRSVPLPTGLFAEDMPDNSIECISRALLAALLEPQLYPRSV